MKMQPPFMVSYSITQKCNLKCKHCYSDSVDQAAPDELSTDEAFRLIDDLSQWGIGLLIIDGGEPLCREDMLDVVKYASTRGMRTTIGSNGTLIDETAAMKMVEAGVMAVAISVDGADAQTHDSFRGIAGAFEQTLKGVEACRNAKLPFQFNTVIRKETLSQLEDLLRLAVDYGADAAEFFDLVATGRAKDGQNNPSSKGVKRQDAPLPQDLLSGLRQDHVVGLREPPHRQHLGRRVPDASARPALSQPVLFTLSQGLSPRS